MGAHRGCAAGRRCCLAHSPHPPTPAIPLHPTAPPPPPQVRANSLQELVYKQGQAGVTKATVSIVFDNTEKERGPVRDQ